MRQHYAYAFLLVISFSANAQIKKQSILLGGELFYYNSKLETDDDHQKSTSGTIGLSLGKAFRENKVVGINISYSPIRQHDYPNGFDTTSLTYNGLDIGLFCREYKKLAKDFYFFAQVNVTFISSNQTEHYKTASADVNTKQIGGSIALTPGISYQIFRKIQLEITVPDILGARYSETKIDSQVAYVKNSKHEEFIFYSNLINGSSLGGLGVGFRFVL